jgi:5'-3' exonuclease
VSESSLDVHLIDGTYELFRHFYGQRSFSKGKNRPFGAVAGVLQSVLEFVERGETHIGVATDHVIESFRNDLWPGYKTGEGIDPDLLSQFPLLEEAMRALGVATWPMVEFEADDALAAAALTASKDPRVERVLICTPDKDLAQCVRGTRVVQMDRRRRTIRDEAGIVEKFGVKPASIPDYLALVGDSADGFPGLPGWGAKSAAMVLARYEHLDDIPDDVAAWDVQPRGAAKLAATLAATRDAANLFLDLATLRTDADVGLVDDWEWRGPAPELEEWAARLGAPGFVSRAHRLAEKRQSSGSRH